MVTTSLSVMMTLVAVMMMTIRRMMTDLCLSARVMYQSKTAVSGKTWQIQRPSSSWSLSSSSLGHHHSHHQHHPDEAGHVHKRIRNFQLTLHKETLSALSTSEERLIPPLKYFLQFLIFTFCFRKYLAIFQYVKSRKNSPKQMSSSIK